MHYIKKICSIFIICLSLNRGIFSESIDHTQVKNILVIHSYHQGLEWTDSITAGIKSVFSDKLDLIEIHYDYLDTKRNPGKEYYNHIVNFQKNKKSIKSINYDIIICSDNNAFTYLIDHGEELYTDIPIVFCGLNNYKPVMLKGKKNITGVVEKVDYRSTIKMMHHLHPDKKRVFLIIDSTATGKAVREEFHKIESEYKELFEFEYISDFLFSEIPERISSLDDDYIIYLLTFNSDSEGNFISYIDGIDLIYQYTENPIYGSWDFYFNNGIVGGMITSGFNQGREAAKMARSVLEGQDIKNIPIAVDGINYFMFDYSEYNRFGIKSSELPEHSIIINEPDNFIELIQKNILILVFPLGIIIVILLIKYFHLRQDRLILQKVTDELDERVAIQTEKLTKQNVILQREINERKTLEEKILKLAHTDSLTDVENRRSFYESANKLFLRSRRKFMHLAVLMMDLDHFKQINDKFGHKLGDQALVVFTSLCKEVIRNSDIIGRVGGEEFIILLVDSPISRAVDVAERIRAKVDNNIILDGDVQLSYTVSIGVTDVKGNDQGITDAIQRADNALYRAKRNGRNRVESI